MRVGIIRLSCNSSFRKDLHRRRFWENSLFDKRVDWSCWLVASNTGKLGSGRKIAEESSTDLIFPDPFGYWMVVIWLILPVAYA